MYNPYTGLYEPDFPVDPSQMESWPEPPPLIPEEEALPPEPEVLPPELALPPEPDALPPEEQIQPPPLTEEWYPPEEEWPPVALPPEQGGPPPAGEEEEQPPPGWARTQREDGPYWVNPANGDLFNPRSNMLLPAAAVAALKPGESHEDKWVKIDIRPRPAPPGYILLPDGRYVPAARAGGPYVNDPSRSGAYDAAAANNMARAQSGLYDAQTRLADAQASRIPGEIDIAIRELALKREQFIAATQEQQARREQEAAIARMGSEQRAAEFGVTSGEQQVRREQEAAIARMGSEQRAAEFGVTQTGFYGGTPTLERIKIISDAERADLIAKANIGNMEAQIRLREIDQRETALQNQRRFGLEEGSLTGRYGGQATMGRERQEEDIAMGRSRFGLEQEMGRGNLGLARDRFGLEKQQQEWAQARDPFSATQKAAQLRAGPAPEQPEQSNYQMGVLGGYADQDEYGPPPLRGTAEQWEQPQEPMDEDYEEPTQEQRRIVQRRQAVY